MNKKISLLAFSVLLLVPSGVQNAFGSLIGDEVSAGPNSVFLKTGIVVADLGNPEIVFPDFASLDIAFNIESEEFFITWKQTNPEPNLAITLGPGLTPYTITDLDWIENGVVIPGIIQDVTCTQTAGQVPIILGDVTFTNNEILLHGLNVQVNGLETVILHCIIDVVHENEIVGGKIIPIEQTSLILAGAQSFSWMIPVTLSILGIGLFVVSRRSER